MARPARDSLTPTERHLRARIGALTSWGRHEEAVLLKAQLQATVSARKAAEATRAAADAAARLAQLEAAGDAA